MFEQLDEVCAELSKSKDEENKKIMRCVIKALISHPYVIFTFLFLFPYLHETHIQIEDYDIKPENFVEDLYLLANDTNLVHELAVRFDKA